MTIINDSKLQKSKVGIILISIIVLAIGLISFDRYITDKRIQHSTQFIESIIESIINDTSYYLEHAKETALVDLQEHSSKISNQYEIHFQDISGGIYEYVVTFDTTTTFYVDVDYNSKNTSLLFFRLDK